MISKFKNIYIIIIILNISCSEKKVSGIKINKETHSFQYNKISSLNENLSLFSKVQSISMLDKNRYVVCTSKPASVILYDLEGNQIRKIGDEGRGPFEYTHPDIVKVHNKKIFVWDANKLNLIIYDFLGNPIKEYKDFDIAINDFVVTKNFVCFYFGGGFSGLIGVYDLVKEQYAYRGIDVSNEHTMLELNKGSGGLNLLNGGLIYMSADKLELNFLELYKFKELRLLSLEDKDFKVDNIDNPIDVTNNHFNKAIEYIMENSYVTGLARTNNMIIISAETGRFKKNKNKTNNASERFSKYYVFNKDYNLIKVIKSEFDTRAISRLITFENNIYMLRHDLDYSNYELGEISFKEI